MEMSGYSTCGESQVGAQLYLFIELFVAIHNSFIDEKFRSEAHRPPDALFRPLTIFRIVPNR